MMNKNAHSTAWLLRTALAVTCCLALALTACLKTGRTPISHPNQINSFDGYAYDTLISAQAALNAAKANISQYPTAKDPLNKAIASYNAAENAYKVYHQSMGQDQSQAATLQTEITELVSAVSAVMSIIKPPPATSGGAH